MYIFLKALVQDDKTRVKLPILKTCQYLRIHANEGHYESLLLCIAIQNSKAVTCIPHVHEGQ